MRRKMLLSHFADNEKNYSASQSYKQFAGRPWRGFLSQSQTGVLITKPSLLPEHYLQLHKEISKQRSFISSLLKSQMFKKCQQSNHETSSDALG